MIANFLLGENRYRYVLYEITLHTLLYFFEFTLFFKDDFSIAEKNVEKKIVNLARVIGICSWHVLLLCILCTFNFIVIVDTKFHQEFYKKKKKKKQNFSHINKKTFLDERLNEWPRFE